MNQEWVEAAGSGKDEDDQDDDYGYGWNPNNEVESVQALDPERLSGCEYVDSESASEEYRQYFEAWQKTDFRENEQKKKEKLVPQQHSHEPLLLCSGRPHSIHQKPEEETVIVLKLWKVQSSMVVRQQNYSRTAGQCEVVERICSPGHRPQLEPENPRI